MNRSPLLLLLCLTAPQAFAGDAPIVVHGFVDTCYTWNRNAPQSHQNFVPGTGTTAEHANEFDLNLAAVDIVHDAKPAGFHVTIVAGSGTDVVHASEPRRDVYRYIYQASVFYKASARLMFEGGIYPSHIGFESFYSKDNWNYTRGWLGEFSPYYQAGVKVSYALSGRWSAQVHLLNGWQNIGENNDAKAIGTQIAFSSARLSAALNTFAGAELPNDNKHLRTFGDFLATWNVSPASSIGLTIDRGRQELPVAAANWFGAGGYLRRTFAERHAVALRVEHFRDPDNGISGTRQSLSGATLTYEFRPAPDLILKCEARRDSSTAPVFARQTDSWTRNETLLVIGAVATF